MKVLNAFICASVLVLGGCGAEVRKPSNNTAKKATDNLVYAQDVRTGLCYAIIGSNSSIDVRSESLSITWVPCDPKVLEMIGK